MARKATDSAPATARDLPAVDFATDSDDNLTMTLVIPADSRRLEAHGVATDISSIAAPGLLYLLANGWSGAITDSVSGHKAKYKAEGMPEDEIDQRLDATRQAKGQAICAGEMRLGGGGGARLDPTDKLVRDAARAALVKQGKLAADAKVRDAAPVIEAFLATDLGQRIAAHAREMAALIG